MLRETKFQVFTGEDSRRFRNGRAIAPIRVPRKREQDKEAVPKARVHQAQTM